MPKKVAPCWSCGGPKTSGRYCSACVVAKEKKAAASVKAWARRVEVTYKITADEYLRIMVRQDGRCAICRRKPGKRRLSVDHDHAIEKILGIRASVRGLLCGRCNEFLGHIRDSIDLAANVRLYLEDPPARKEL